MENRREQLKTWIATLDENQKDEIIVEMVDFAIDAEYVKFYNDTKVPYFDGDGENIDGTKSEYED